MILQLQVHHSGIWHDAAEIEFLQPDLGIGGRTAVTYDVGYFADWGAIALADDNPIRDWQALSVRTPIDLRRRATDNWPAFLLDLLPQGNARRRICEQIGLREDDPAAELPLLLRGAGSPIGNFRIKESWNEERSRIDKQASLPDGLMMADILNRTELFIDIAERFSLIASGSSGVQGEWPKLLLTQSRSGLWYPDSLVDDTDAVQHAIVKFVRRRDAEDALILEAEAGYLEIARSFGVRVGDPLLCNPNILVIPRFDRAVATGGKVIRRGQESLVSALGKAQFGYVGFHEQYLAVLRRYSSEPQEDIIDYVLRDALNMAMGNPDNHGRNSALQKREDGTVRLSPLYDFAPMRLDRRGIARSTRWECLAGRDLNPDWSLICAAAAGDDRALSERLVRTLREKVDFLRRLPDAARGKNIPEEVIARAIVQHDRVADQVEQLPNG